MAGYWQGLSCRADAYLEPFPGRNALSTRQTIVYLLDTYGAHPAFHRGKEPDRELITRGHLDGFLLGGKTAETIPLRRAAEAVSSYLFSTNGTLLATLKNPVPWSGDYFSQAVGALGPDRVMVGATSHDGGKTTPGVAFLFSTNGALLTTFTNPTPDWADNFGRPLVAFGTDRVLIGAPQDDTGAFDAGVAYLFTTNGTLLTTFTNPSPNTYDHFGSVVAGVGADRVLIGAPANQRLGGVDGTAHLFHNRQPASRLRFRCHAC